MYTYKLLVIFYYFFGCTIHNKNRTCDVLYLPQFLNNRPTPMDCKIIIFIMSNFIIKHTTKLKTCSFITVESNILHVKNISWIFGWCESI